MIKHENFMGKLVEKLCKTQDVPYAELAETLKCSRQNMSQRIKRGLFYYNEMEDIGKILGAKFEARYVLPDGSVITVGPEDEE